MQGETAWSFSLPPVKGRGKDSAAAPLSKLPLSGRLLRSRWDQGWLSDLWFGCFLWLWGREEGDGFGEEVDLAFSWYADVSGQS